MKLSQISKWNSKNKSSSMIDIATSIKVKRSLLELKKNETMCLLTKNPDLALQEELNPHSI